MTTTTEFKVRIHDVGRDLCEEVDWCLLGANSILASLDAPQLAEDTEWFNSPAVDLPLEEYRHFVWRKLLQTTLEGELCVAGFNVIMDRLEIPRLGFDNRE